MSATQNNTPKVCDGCAYLPECGALGLEQETVHAIMTTMDDTFDARIIGGIYNLDETRQQAIVDRLRRFHEICESRRAEYSAR